MKERVGINKAHAVEGLGRYTYQFHPRFILDNVYYCRMANTVMPASRNLYDCYHCPLMRGFTQGEQQGLPECWYYDFQEVGYHSAREEKARIDRLIGWYGVPEFPDYVQPGERGIFAAGIVQKALQYAAMAHKGSFRKGTKIPFIVHPVEVAMIACELTEDMEVVSAAVLHDVVEDTIYTRDDIQRVFGERIAWLVAAESENKRVDMPPEQTWRIRKEESLTHLAQAPKEVKVICLADKLSNIRAIQADYEKLGEKLWARFNQADPSAHAWYYGSIRDICKEGFEEMRAWQEYAQIVNKVFKPFLITYAIPVKASHILGDSDVNDKIKRYYMLVDQAKGLYPKHVQPVAEAAIRMEWCDECEEINLWTYWQGRNHIDSARIMLVGQDWGCPWEDEGTVQNVQKMNQGYAMRYLDNNEICKTDQSLIELFNSIGYKDIAANDYPELFFTNLILGYRNHKSSGEFKTTWINDCKVLFEELVKIIEPEIILCLGKDTAIGTLKALKAQVPPLLESGKFNAFIEGSENPIKVWYGEGKTAYLFVLAHCGPMGSLNRNKQGDGKTNSDLALQIDDWKRILKYYKPRYI